MSLQPLSYFASYRRAGFTGNITLIKLRGRNVTHSDLYKPTPSMESILHRSFIRDRLVKPGHVDEIISLSSKTSLPPINQPSTFKAWCMYTFCNYFCQAQVVLIGLKNIVDLMCCCCLLFL